VHAVNPTRIFPIHEAQLSDRGVPSLDAWFAEEFGEGYRWLAPGETA
jgi:hypothetical protein